MAQGETDKMLDIDEIIRKRDERKQMKARAEGSLDRTLQMLEAHGITTVDECKVKLEEFKVDIANNEKRQGEILKEINEAVAWDAV